MTDFNQKAAEFLAAEKEKLAARQMRHLMKMPADDDKPLEAITAALRQSLSEAAAGTPDDFADILTAQARLMDAAFYYYATRAEERPYHEIKHFKMALLAQSQTRQTIQTWKKLRETPGDKNSSKTK
jgi:hypothetical protein